MTAIRNKWEEMSWFRRVLLIVMTAEILGFAIATAVAAGRMGMEYDGWLLYLRKDGDVTWYEGEVDGEDAAFSVTPDGTVEYRWGEYAYGPYQVAEDPTALPEGYGGTGVEVRQEGQVLFRGCLQSGRLFDEDGELMWDTGSYAFTNDAILDLETGREVSRQEYHEPSLSSVVRVALGPELTRRGSVGLYLAVTFLALLNIVQILFPEALFKLSLLGHIRSADIDDAEPSSFYIAMEHIEWVVLAGVCLVVYVMALDVIV